MKIGVRLHDLGRNTALNLAKEAKEIGFDSVQLVCVKALEGESSLPTELNEEKVKNITQAFKNNDIKIAMLGAYFNPVHSNKEKVKMWTENFCNFLKYEKAFEADFVGTETGSFSDEPWVYHPTNRTVEGYNEMKEVFSKISEAADLYDADFAFEGAFGHVCYEPRVLRQLYDDLGSDHFYFTFDLYNYLDISNYKNYLQILEDGLKLLKDRIKIVHLKDFIVVDNKLKQVDLGEGIIDYKKMLKLYLDNCPDAYFIFEGVSKNGMKKSFDFVKKIEGEIL